MNNANLRDPSSLASRVYIGHLNENISQELLDIKFSAYGKIIGFLRTSPGFAFIQYDHAISAENAIAAENGSFLAGQRILVKAAEMKSQKRPMSTIEAQDHSEQNEPMNKSKFYIC